MHHYNQPNYLPRIRSGSCQNPYDDGKNQIDHGFPSANDKNRNERISQTLKVLPNIHKKLLKDCRTTDPIDVKRTKIHLEKRAGQNIQNNQEEVVFRSSFGQTELRYAVQTVY